MAAVEWTKDLSIGVPEIDEQHAQLVAILNQLDEAVKTGKGTRIMHEILVQLLAYTEQHFAAEEAWMEEIGYPRLESHRNLHRQLMKKVGRFRVRFEVNGQRITREMHDFLENWLVHHILEDDKAAGEHANTAVR